MRARYVYEDDMCAMDVGKRRMRARNVCEG